MMVPIAGGDINKREDGDCFSSMGQVKRNFFKKIELKIFSNYKKEKLLKNK